MKNILKNIISRFVDKIKENKVVLLIFFIIFILLLMQHSVVSMYFDDFGNASLSYGTIIDNVNGTDYSITQLLEWAKFIYLNWGGRILYAVCFIIPLLKNGITMYMFVQTIVITLILYFIYKIVSLKSNYKNSWIILILCFILYTIIDMAYLRQGIYWASASVLYVWPLLPFMIYIYIYFLVSNKIESGKKFNKKIFIIILAVLNFFATFSQEQIGIAVIVFNICLIIFYHITTNKFKDYFWVDLINFLVSLISYIFLFAAPGNWVRMDSNISFSNMNFFEKIIHNFPLILNGIFKDKMKIFMLILYVLIIVISIRKVFLKRKTNSKIYYVLIPTLIIAIEVILILFNEIYANEKCFYIISILSMLAAFLNLIIYFWPKNKKEYLTIPVSAASSVFCLLMSPSVIERTFIPFIFLIMIIIIKIIMEILERKDILYFITLMLVLIIGINGIKNFIEVYKGYRDNYSICQLNDEILRKYNKEENKEKIYLYKEKNIWYGNEQPYTISMDEWIKEYYDLPEELSFEWIDIYN